MRALIPLLVVAVSVASASAEWSPAVRVTNDPDTSRTEVDGGRNVTIVAGVLSIVWSDDRDGNAEIYFRERVGTVWSAPVRLTDDGGHSAHAAIGTWDGEVRVVWEDDRSGHPEIWTKRRMAQVWTADSCLTCDDFDSTRPALDHLGERLVWEETKDGNREIYYRHWLGDGTWEPEFRVSDDPGESSHPSVATLTEVRYERAESEAIGLIVWQDDRDGNWEIYSRLYTWSEWYDELRVTSDPGNSCHPSAAVEWNTCSDAIFLMSRVAWQDDRDGNEEIYLAEGAPGVWYRMDRVTNTSTPSRHPSLSTTRHVVPFIFGLTLCEFPAIAWEERAVSGTSGSIRYIDLGPEGSSTTISASGADPFNPSLALDEVFYPGLDGVRNVEVVWTDQRDGNPEIYEAQNVIIIETSGVPEIPLEDGHLSLARSRPNPFRGSTSFTVRLDRPAQLEVRILDAAGRVVRRLAHDTRAKGPHTFIWNGIADDDHPAAAGTYFICAESGDERRTQKVVLVR